MKQINYKEDYFKTLLEGEGEAISWAEAVSIYHLGQTPANGSTLLIRFDETDANGIPAPSLFSLYCVHFLGGKYFVVNKAEERLSHGLGKVITPEYKDFARSEKSTAWWSSLILGNPDDTLILSELCTELNMPVCDDIMIPFAEFIGDLMKLVSRWKIVAGGSFSSVILSACDPAFVSLPVRFAIQEVFGCPVYVLPEGAVGNIDLTDSENYFVIPRAILDKELNLNPAVSVSDVIGTGSVSFFTPVDDNFGHVDILGGINLGDLYGETPTPDFTAGNISLKRVTLRIGKTGYGSILIGAESGDRIIAGAPAKNSEIVVLASSNPKNEELPMEKAPKDDGLRLKGFSLNCDLPVDCNLSSMSEEQLLSEKERLSSAIDFDIITPDTNIFLRYSKKEDGTASMYYAPMLLSLATLQQKKNPSFCGFEVNSAVQEELYRFQCDKVNDDSAWERSRSCAKVWGSPDKIALKVNARRAVRLLDSLASENKVCSSPEEPASDGKTYADPLIIKRCMEIISEGKSLMLITDDTDLRYKVKVAAQRYCDAHPGTKKPAVLSGGQVFAVVSRLHKIEKELSLRSVSVAC